MSDLSEHMRERGNALMCHPVANGTIACTEEAGALLLRAADALDTLCSLDARLRQCMELGLSAAEAYDSGYQEATAEALAASPSRG